MKHDAMMECESNHGPRALEATVLEKKLAMEEYFLLKAYNY